MRTLVVYMYSTCTGFKGNSGVKIRETRVTGSNKKIVLHLHYRAYVVCLLNIRLFFYYALVSLLFSITIAFESCTCIPATFS